jgi:hypothetical protein
MFVKPAFNRRCVPAVKLEVEQGGTQAWYAVAIFMLRFQR